MSVQQTFINNLKFYRKSEKISQKDLSIALNKGFNYINSIECGASFPPPNVIDQIAAFLRIEPETLFAKNVGQENADGEFKSRFSDYLKKELSARICREIELFCDEMEK